MIAVECRKSMPIPCACTCRCAHVHRYEWLAKKCVTATVDYMQSTFSWAYLVLCWNLMARSDNVQMLLFEHIRWENDAMVVQFVKTKTDSTGAHTDPKKVYANPVKPHICPVLALAVYVFDHHGGPGGGLKG